MKPIDRVLQEFRNRGLRLASAGDGWSAQCPAHEDRRPSLSIREGEDGCVLIRCHAGCSIDEVCDALGIAKHDLFEKRDGPSIARGGSREKRDRVFPTAREAVAALEAQHGPRTASWTYTDVTGDPVGVVVRWDSTNGKTIRPVSRTDKGWAMVGMPTPRPVYQLPDLAAAARVFITEGEKAADAVRSLGLTATTSAHGGNGAAQTDWSSLARHDLEVVLLPDNDSPGEKYAEAVIGQLKRLNPRPIVKVVRLPKLPPGGDAVEFIESLEHELDVAEAVMRDHADRADAIVWDDPIAVDLLPRPFPTEVLPPAVRRFVEHGAATIGCDPSFVAVATLVAMAGAIGNSHRVMMKRGWSEPPVLWGAIVGESGTMKSPAFRLALAPIHEIQQELFEEHRLERKEYDKKRAQYDADMRAWKKKPSGDPPLEPEEPVLERLVVSDVTVESLAPILDDNPRGLIAARDELAGWVRSFDRYTGTRGADAANWLSMYDAGRIIVDRKTGPQRTIIIPNAAMSVIGGIQPAILASAFGGEHRESGLLARLLLVMPPRRPVQWSDAELSEAVERGYADVIRGLRELTFGVDDQDNLRPKCIPLDLEAKRRFRAWHDELGVEMNDLTGDLCAAFSKLKGIAARLALIIHCVRVVTDDPDLHGPSAIDVASIEAAISLTDWFKHEVQRVYDVLHEDEGDRERRELIEWIERHKGEVKTRDVTHGLRRFRNKPDAAEAALEDLVHRGFGCWRRPASGKRGGRPTKHFILNRPVTGSETPPGGPEDEGFGDGDTSDNRNRKGDDAK